MTWEFQTTISDVIHRVTGPNGEQAWGVDHRGFDEERCRSLSTAEVELPIGPRSLLIVPAFPGGLVLDVVRTYQGLTDPELCTLFLGIVAALRDAESAEDRLTLDAFALDAEGRPVLVPGVAAPLPSTPRRALGEMLYHAACGRAWAESLLPVNLALAESSPTLRSVVGELLADLPPEVTSTPGGGLTAALDEVAEAMRQLARPAALPLVPAERGSDPEAALTARLRVAAGHAPNRHANEGHPVKTAVTPASVCSGSGAAEGTATARSNDPATSLRAASRRERRRRRPARSVSKLRESLRERVRGMRSRLGEVRGRFGDLRGAMTGRGMIIGAVCLTLLGGVIVWGSRPGAAPAGETPSAAQDRQPPDGEPTATDDGAPPVAPQETSAAADGLTPGENEAVRVLKELCTARAEALSSGDADALRLLTVPGSAAAAADELVDESVFAGQDYSIAVEDISIETSAADRIVARAQMRSSAGTGGAEERFEARAVEFELQLFEGRWRVAEVAEAGGD